MANELGDCALFRMYAAQLKLFGSHWDTEELHELIDEYLSAELPEQYIALFKMVCDLDLAQYLGDAGVELYYQRRQSLLKAVENNDSMNNISR